MLAGRVSYPNQAVSELSELILSPYQEEAFLSFLARDPKHASELKSFKQARRICDLDAVVKSTVQAGSADFDQVLRNLAIQNSSFRQNQELDLFGLRKEAVQKDIGRFGGFQSTKRIINGKQTLSKAAQGGGEVVQLLGLPVREAIGRLVASERMNSEV
uniref:Uncharacterized protein n=1 Tax=Strombidium rassoulzadegani TaxID=1082188 RepID=A0A7S3FY51_9SPIT|mmetsp:Transcript_9851/g.16572  ORF Transcript_9851/g.16572 Transcript_9851/m.16572 type:complete len:159 (+) Transcript_9851:1712-2188(+)